jgi:hypothetical protein
VDASCPQHRLLSRIAATLALVTLAGALTTPSGSAVTSSTWHVALQRSFADVPAGVAWQDGQTYGAWRSRFNGYGTSKVRVLQHRLLSQRPKASARPDETHASLVTTRQRYGDVDATLRMRTVRQLRTGSKPNPWEVAWFLWNYQDNSHFYYLVLKPTGWELGKEDPAYQGAQRFLATGPGNYPVGRWYNVRVRQVDNVITAWANGVLLTRLRDVERPYLSGRVGLYNEDAKVRFRRVVIRTR